MPSTVELSTLEALQQLRTSIDDDIEARMEAYQAEITRVKAAAPAVLPLALLAHGDSWFDYPLDGNGPKLKRTDIIAQLPALGKPKPHIMNVSHFGDAATVEMGLQKQKRLIKCLKKTTFWLVNEKPDAILISAGGNDIVGDPFCIFLNYATPGASGLNKTRFDEALGMVKACYLSLFALRDKYAPGVPIFGHCYDFAVPDGGAPICAGPWLKPSLKEYGWTDPAKAKAIVHQALVEFKKLLKGLAADPNNPAVDPNNFTLINTQGTLHDNDWANELHPKPPGFNQFAKLFAEALRDKFPGRI